MANAGSFARCRLPSIIRRAEKVPGAWVAECVPLDIATQGDSLEHALEMLVDAVDMIVDDDLERGVDPLRTRIPSPESVAQLQALLAGPLVPVDIRNVDAEATVVLALVDVVRPVVPAMQSKPPPGPRYESLGAARKPADCHAAC
jgi:predicted RNase H-like HicB family nuclease